MAPPRSKNRPPQARFSRSQALAIRRRDGGCMISLPGCTGAADEADHIVGWQQAVALGWDLATYNDPANGQAVCHYCHSIKTQGEARAGAVAAAEKTKAKRQRPHPGLRAE